MARQILISLEKVRHFMQNKGAKLRRMAKGCQRCENINKHCLYEFLWEYEQWVKEIEDEGDRKT